jgi:Ca-activated chloride channel family protein
VSVGAPWALGAGAVAVVVAATLVVYGERARRRALERFGEIDLLAASSRLPSERRRAWGSGLLIVGLALIAVALGRPQGGTQSRAVRRAGADVLFLLDLSRSMTATDVEPSRLAAAKRAASAIARALPDDRVGRLVFGGSGFLQLPPTVDRSTFQLFLDAASPVDIPDVSTNLEAAAGLAAVAVSDVGSGPASTGLVVLSDGEDVEGKLEGAIRALSEAHVRTDAVGVGTPGGVVLMDRDSTGALVPHRDPDGGPVTTHLVELNLQDIARRTGGAYARWDGDQSVAPIVADLSRLRPRIVAGQAREAGADRFQWPLAVGVVLLLIEPWVSDRRGRA